MQLSALGSGGMASLGAESRAIEPLDGSGVRSSKPYRFSGTAAQISEGIQCYRGVGEQDFRLDFPSPSFGGMLQVMACLAAEVHRRLGA